MTTIQSTVVTIAPASACHLFWRRLGRIRYWAHASPMSIVIAIGYLVVAGLASTALGVLMS